VSGERIPPTIDPPQPVDLDRLDGRGPLWGIASADLNATLLCWDEGDGVAVHVNSERDVLVVVLGGWGIVSVGARAHVVVRHDALLVPKGSRWSIRAGGKGLRYLSVHLARGGLRIEPARTDLD
jgi:quercetin dioxygenase-like cupin family protein